MTIPGLESAKVYIKCPNTGNDVWTGSLVLPANFADWEISYSKMACSCGEEHMWSKADAFQHS